MAVNKKRIKEILGSDFKTYPLKSIRRRVVQRFSHAEMPKQPVKLIVTQEGKKYKLIQFGKENISRALFIQKIRSFLETLDFIPKIYHLDDPLAVEEPLLLSEYIEGQFPDCSTHEFAASLGWNLGRLHIFRLESISSAKFVEEVLSDLQYMFSRRVVSPSLVDRLREKIFACKPQKIMHTLVNGDLQYHNLVLSPDGRLMFIDMDAFRAGIPGYYLMRSDIYLKIDRVLFKENYLKAGGSDYMFRHELFILIACYISCAASSLRLAYNLPFFELRRRIRRFRDAKQKVRYLESILNRV